MPMTVVAPHRYEPASYHDDPSWRTAMSRDERRRRARRAREDKPLWLPVLMQGPGFQIPVWEIRSYDGHISYVAREHVNGYLPVGLLDSYTVDGNTRVSVCALSETTNYIHRSRLEGSKADENDTSIVIPQYYYELIEA